MNDLTPVGFERIIDILNKRRVRYVVIGGVAAILQGAELPRTADIDITPASDDQNKKRLALALKDLDGKLRVPGLDEGFAIPLDEKTFNDMATMTFTTRFGPFDISFIPDGTQGYEDLRKDAVMLHVLGVEIPVASLQAIIRSKRATGREKDVEHVAILNELLEEKPDE